MLVKDYIQEKKVKADVIRIDIVFPTVKHAARYLQVDESQMFKVLLLQGESKRLVMCIVSGTDSIEFKKVETITGIRRLRFADVEVIMKTTGFMPNYLPPFGFDIDFPILIEKSMMEYEYGYTSSGSENSLLKLTPQEIVRVTDAKMDDIVYMEDE